MQINPQDILTVVAMIGLFLVIVGIILIFYFAGNDNKKE